MQNEKERHLPYNLYISDYHYYKNDWSLKKDLASLDNVKRQFSDRKQIRRTVEGKLVSSQLPQIHWLYPRFSKVVLTAAGSAIKAARENLCMPTYTGCCKKLLKQTPLKMFWKCFVFYI